MSGLSGADLQILITRLTDIAEEMGAVLRRGASSPNIKERADCSAALFTADGALLVQAEHIPVHLGSMPASVAAVLDRLGSRLGPGSQAIVNDPYCGGTHLNDVTLVAPCWVDGRLVGWAANRAHHADLGGTAPGSMPADALEIDEEGLRLAPMVLTEAVQQRVVSSSRTPIERAGDLAAQIGANVVGVDRLASLADEPFAAVLDHGEAMMRAAIRAAPDGSWSYLDQLDSVGPRPSQQRPATVSVQVTIVGDHVLVDFAGSAGQARGNVNAVEAVTISAALFAVRSVLAPDAPVNGGTTRVIEVRAPSGSIVAARPPAAVGAGNVEVSQRVADACLGALAQGCPELVAAASQGTMNNVIVGGAGWVYYETVGGGQGASPGLDGMSGVHTGMTNTRNTPIEALEREYPMRVRRLTLRSGSGGAGQASGGEGIERDLEVLEDTTLSLITERRVSRPWGLAGGEDGASGENWLLPGGDETQARPLGDKVTMPLRRGDVLRLRTPGGGGWGTATAGGRSDAT